MVNRVAVKGVCPRKYTWGAVWTLHTDTYILCTCTYIHPYIHGARKVPLTVVRLSEYQIWQILVTFQRQHSFRLAFDVFAVLTIRSNYANPNIFLCIFFFVCTHS